MTDRAVGEKTKKIELDNGIEGNAHVFFITENPFVQVAAAAKMYRTKNNTILSHLLS